MDIAVRWIWLGDRVCGWPGAACKPFPVVTVVFVVFMPACMSTKHQMCWWDSRQMKGPLVRQPLLFTPNADENASGSTALQPSRVALSKPGQSAFKRDTTSPALLHSIRTMSGTSSSFALPRTPAVIVSGALSIANVQVPSSGDQFVIPTETGDVYTLTRSSGDSRRGSYGVRPVVGATDGFGLMKGHCGPVLSVSPHPSLPG